MATSAKSHPTPVFLLGLQRSGTTWFANVISQHSRVVAVASQDHFGILASIYFSHFVPYYGDLDEEDNFRRFAADFAASDYYVVSGLDPTWLQSRDSRSYPDIFRAMMDEVSRLNGGADFWLEKTTVHTPLAEELSEAYPDAVFLCILRQPRAAIASHLWLHGKRRSTGARIRAVLSLSLHRSQQRVLVEFCRQHRDRCFLTRYEELLADSEGVARRSCEFLGINYEPSMLRLPWRRNTSFISMDRRDALRLSDRIIIAVSDSILNLLPVSWLKALLDWRRANQLARHGRVIFPDWTWRRRDAGQTTTPPDRGLPPSEDRARSAGARTM